MGQNSYFFSRQVSHPEQETFMIGAQPLKELLSRSKLPYVSQNQKFELSFKVSGIRMILQAEIWKNHTAAKEIDWVHFYQMQSK